MVGLNHNAITYVKMGGEYNEQRETRCTAAAASPRKEHISDSLMKTHRWNFDREK